jgi:hypothetical protein
MNATPGNGLVRCRYCPGATEAVRRVAYNPCPSCRARVALLSCPDCGGTLQLESAATKANTIVVFCNDCEFCFEVTHE